MKSQTEIIRAVNPWYVNVAKNYLKKVQDEKLAKLNLNVKVKSPRKKKIKQDSNVVVPTKEGYIYVPALGFYVAKERSYFEKDFNECQKLLCDENAKMLNLDEARKFLNYAKEYYTKVYNEILEVKSPRRAEWIDANFKLYLDDLYIHYHIFDSSGKIKKIEEKLDKNTLMRDKNISLDDWLNTAHTKQGLPRSNISSRDSYFRSPMQDNNSVACIFTNSDKLILYCSRNPSNQDLILGVRKCFARLEDIK